MQDDESTIRIFSSDDGYLLFGSEAALTVLDAATCETDITKLSASTLATAAEALGAASTLRQGSGRWMKLTEESARFIKQSGATLAESATLRRRDIPGLEGTQFIKQLSFEKLALVTPAAPAALASLAFQMALDAAIAEIRTYLETMDAKLNELLRQRRTQLVGSLRGIGESLEEAFHIYAATGRVTHNTWSKVQADSRALLDVQGEAIEELGNLADATRKGSGNSDRTAKALAKAAADVPFWLGILGRAIAAQDRLYILELAHVRESTPADLPAHAQAIRDSRDDRIRRIEAALTTMQKTVLASATVSNLARAMHPISAGRITAAAEEVRTAMAGFAAHTEVCIDTTGRAPSTTWSNAARSVVGDAAGRVSEVGSGAVGGARDAVAALQAHREDAVLRKAERIRLRRGAAALPAPGPGEDAGSADPTAAAAPDGEPTV